MRRGYFYKIMIEKWKTIERSKTINYKIFNLAWVTRQHPQWNKKSKFVLLESPRWVNIIPITKSKNVVLIEQYRHGIDDITLEVPGGLVESDEDPLYAAERECAEETGYIGTKNAFLLGENLPNPAFLNNSCYSYVWFDCIKQKEQNLDKNEDIRVIEVPLTEIPSMILNGKIKHSLVLTAFFFFSLKYDFNLR